MTATVLDAVLRARKEVGEYNQTIEPLGGG